MELESRNDRSDAAAAAADFNWSQRWLSTALGSSRHQPKIVTNLHPHTEGYANDERWSNDGRKAEQLGNTINGMRIPI